MESWLKDWLKFQEEHQVIIVFKRMISLQLENAEKYLKLHFEYYKSLNKKHGPLQYGRALTGDAVYILLHVRSANDFEEIIQNDPAIDKVYTVDSVLAFSDSLA